jgi:ferritin-like metal-binding protein YciE
LLSLHSEDNGRRNRRRQARFGERQKGASFNSGLVGSALRAEHNEIAGYEACIPMAITLGMSKVARLLNSNLKEELNAAKKITAARAPIMKQSAREP